MVRPCAAPALARGWGLRAVQVEDHSEVTDRECGKYPNGCQRTYDQRNEYWSAEAAPSGFERGQHDLFSYTGS
jgi:hypothetical protein